MVLWHYDANLPSQTDGFLPWQYGAVNPSPWSGQAVVLELITESQDPAHIGSSSSWAGLTLSAASSAKCATSLSSSAPSTLRQRAQMGRSQSQQRPAALGTPLEKATGSRLLRPGRRQRAKLVHHCREYRAVRQSALVVAGHPLTVTQQAGAPVSSPPAPPVSSASAIPSIHRPTAWLSDGHRR